MQKQKCPVTLVNGMLGAGKSTLINHLLVRQHGKKYAVILNELGAKTIDSRAAIVVEVAEELYTMNNGCLCCRIRGDLIRIITTLLKRSEQFDGIIVETRGLAELTPAIQTFLVDDDLKRKVYLDTIVTLVDAEHSDHYLLKQSDCHAQIHAQITEQLALADTIIINKTDLVPSLELNGLSDTLRLLNPYASIHCTAMANVPCKEVLGREYVDLQDFALQDSVYPESSRQKKAHLSLPQGQAIQNIRLLTDKPLIPEKFSHWIRKFVANRGSDILRAKGVLNLAGQDHRYLLQGVHRVMDGAWGEAWAMQKPQSYLVLVGRKLDAKGLQESFLACTET